MSNGWEHPLCQKARQAKWVIPGIPRQVHDGCAAVTLRWGQPNLFGEDQSWAKPLAICKEPEAWSRTSCCHVVPARAGRLTNRHRRR